jgi:tRNA1(Val) A37 N6-methylase TrmN6
MNAPELSEDALLGGRLRLRQPTQGYRIAIDPVLLAAAVPAVASDNVLDIGCGVGAAALCLAARVPECRVTGIEAQMALVRLAVENIALNSFEGRVRAMGGDILRPPPRLEPGSFTQVMANPPYLEEGSAMPPPNPAKAVAQIEGVANLAYWVRFALSMTRPRGGVTFIHRADRLDALLGQLTGRAGAITVLPLWPTIGTPAKRVIVHARKDIASPTRLLPGLVLHGVDGHYTKAAEAILRHGERLDLQL